MRYLFSLLSILFVLIGSRNSINVNNSSNNEHRLISTMNSDSILYMGNAHVNGDLVFHDYGTAKNLNANSTITIHNIELNLKPTQTATISIVDYNNNANVYKINYRSGMDLAYVTSDDGVFGAIALVYDSTNNKESTISLNNKIEVTCLINESLETSPVINLGF